MPTANPYQGTPPDQTQRVQALDVSKSFIVQAPAGSGKTSLLVDRYLELLCVVRTPEEILAITFTRKAAREMRTRVLDQLRNSENSEIARRVLTRDRERSWELIANPRRLHIQTIDSFVRSVVEQLPYKSRFNLEFDTIDNASELYEEAARRALERIGDNKNLFAEDIAHVIARTDNDYSRTLNLLTEMLGSREHWLEFLARFIDPHLQSDTASKTFEQLNEARQLFSNHLIHEVCKGVDEQVLEELTELVEFSLDQTDPDLVTSGDKNRAARLERLVQLCLTEKNTPRKSVNITLGFPRGEAGELKKAQLFATSAKFLSQVDIEKLKRLRNLPPDELSTEHRQNIQSYAILLVVAANELTTLFQERKVTDFTEFAIAAKRALVVDDAPTQLALALDYRIKHILVDEYQDTSTSQSELLNLLMDGWEPDDGNTFFAVGDPMQAIYAFRNANLGNFLQADKGGIRNRTLTRLQLSTNFRSTSKHVEVSNTLFQRILGEKSDADLDRVAFARSQTIQSNGSSNDFGFTLCRSDSEHLEARHIANRVRAIKAAQVNLEETIAILVRTRTRLDPLFTELRRADIAWKGVDIEALTALPVIRDLHTLMCALFDVNDKQSWAALLMSPLVGLELADIEQFTDIECGVDMLFPNPELDVSTDTAAILNRVRYPILSALHSETSAMRSRIEPLWYQLGGAGAYPSDDDPSSAALKANAEHYFEVLDSFSNASLHPDRVWKKVQTIYATELNQNADVEIMTIHKAKGLEFDHVILPNLHRTPQQNTRRLAYFRPKEGTVVVAVKTEDEDDPLYANLHEEASSRFRNETARLLYVAVTRAKRSLWFSATQPPNRPQKARSDSFLRLLQDAELAQTIDEEVIEGPASQDTTLDPIRVWRRVDPSFRFAPPAEFPALPATILPDESTSVSDPTKLRLGAGLVESTNLHMRRFKDFSELVQLQLGLSESMAIGQLVHAEMQRLVEAQQIQFPEAARIDMWRNQLRTQGFTATQISAILDSVQNQIRTTLASETGKWLLDPDHDCSEVESAYTFSSGGVRQTIVVDRTFVCDDVRWIVDFKSSKIPDQANTSLELKALDHQWQLLLYAEVFRTMELLPIKAGIYFTDVAEFVEVDVSQAAKETLQIESADLGTIWNRYRASRA